MALAKTNPLHDYGLSTEVRVTGSACQHTHYLLTRLAASAA